MPVKNVDALSRRFIDLKLAEALILSPPSFPMSKYPLVLLPFCARRLSGRGPNPLKDIELSDMDAREKPEPPEKN